MSDRKRRKLPPWPVYRLLLWVVTKLDRLTLRLMPAEMRVLRSAALLGASGFALVRAIPTRSFIKILEAQAI